MKAKDPFVPRNGHTARAAIVARISGCRRQKEISLDDQDEHGREVVRGIYDGQTEFTLFATKGKGERLDRPELEKIEKLIRTGELDFLVMEDIGRLIRGSAAHRLVGIAVDHGVRVLAPNDCIDTAEDSWEEDVQSACRDHTANQTHTSKRIKKKLMTRFIRSGDVTPRPIAGYIKPKGAKKYAEWTKDESAAPIIAEGWRILKATLNGASIADYFNRVSFPVGVACRRKDWDGTSALRFYRNPILKGMPARGTKHSVKHHKTGRRACVPNPKGPTYREEPHLAFLDPAEWDEWIPRLAEANACKRRENEDGVHPRSRVAKKRTRSFGQRAPCYYCGRNYVWGGNGITDNLMCLGSREYRCWNAIGFNGPLAAQRVVTVIIDRLLQVQGLESEFQRLVEHAASGESVEVNQRRSRLAQEEAACRQAEQNLADGIAKLGVLPALEVRAEEMRARRRHLAAEQCALDQLAARRIELPASIAELRQRLEEELHRLPVDSLEFGELIRELVPEFQVYLVRMFDGSHLLPRAKVRLNLLGSFAEGHLVPGLSELLGQELTLDLFVPPQREAYRIQAVALAAQGLEQRDIAKRLPGKPTQTVVWKAIALDRKLKTAGRTTPYDFVSEPPADYTKLRRHKHARYRFETAPGYIPQTL